ncbi:hypothetical protein RJT51_09385 [Klebsiella variicola]|uniref:hypothetical protein n=1 Tax=Klebsiella variicola TaxID=244366 RepID=UPI00190C7EDC|nr:hypothetical protein [Klebsiella variicola]MBK2544490.1 hypothetical protein [Klebsiella variicola]WNN08720.1 hypothetical protein RJT51_09385 [Klebsiella variicola]
MTITPQEVNELIASLESTGELSIKETKVMALAKAYQQLAAENVALKTFCKNAAFDADYEAELGMEMGGFTDALNDIETPATDRIVAGIKADAITASLDACSDYLETDCVMDRLDISYEEAETRTSGAIEFHDAMVNFANQLREGADK